MVRFAMSGRAMFLNGWADQQANTGHADLDAVIETARRSARRVGKGYQYVFECDAEQAEWIAHMTRVLGEAWAMDSGDTGRDGRVLIRAADAISKALPGEGRDTNPRNLIMNMESVIDKLSTLGIHTMADADAYALANPLPNGDIDSRYGTLKRLVGETAADNILHELAIRQCCRPVK